MVWRGRLGRNWSAREVDFVLGETFECRFRQTEILRQNALGGAANPVSDAECAEFREVAIVKDQNEMSWFVAQALEHVPVTAGEIPDVARLELVRLGIAIGIDHRRADAAFD